MIRRLALVAALVVVAAGCGPATRKVIDTISACSPMFAADAEVCDVSDLPTIEEVLAEILGPLPFVSTAGPDAGPVNPAPTQPAVTATPGPSPAAVPTAPAAAPSPTPMPTPPATASPTRVLPAPTPQPTPAAGGAAVVVSQWLTRQEMPPRIEDGNFRTGCTTSHFAADDPIVFPGQPGASHLHMFFGNTRIDAFSTPDSLRTAGGGTCWGGPLNRSGYWIPALLDAQGDPQVPVRIDVYYKTRHVGEVRDIPAGMVMLGGSPEITFGWRSWDWSCLAAEHDVKSATFAEIGRCAPGDRLRGEVRMPSCWNGRDLDSWDHRSHLAYEIAFACPATHPVPLPSISYIFEFNLPADGSLTGLHLSSDMGAPPGSTFHADWMNGWDPGIQSRWFSGCLAGARDCIWGGLGDGERLAGQEPGLEPTVP